MYVYVYISFLVQQPDSEVGSKKNSNMDKPIADAPSTETGSEVKKRRLTEALEEFERER